MPIPIALKLFGVAQLVFIGSNPVLKKAVAWLLSVLTRVGQSEF